MNRPAQLLLTLTLAATPLSPALAQTPPANPTPHLTPEQFNTALRNEEPAIDARRMRIDAELADLAQHPPGPDDPNRWAAEWAGTYYTGNHLSINIVISIAPKSGVTYRNSGCAGPADANHGDIVKVFPDGLELKLAIDPTASSTAFMSSRLYFLRSGTQHMVAPESQMMNAVNACNGCIATRPMHRVPVKVIDDNRDLEAGTPDQLPAKYAALLVHHPMKLVVAKTSMASTPVTDNLHSFEWRIDFTGGRDQDIYPGIKLACSGGTITIDQVDEKTSVGTLTAYGDANDNFTPPAPGRTFTIPGAAPLIDQRVVDPAVPASTNRK